MSEPESRSTLLRSQLQCPLCDDLIASIHRHDFQTCKCGGLSIDGGRDYLRVAYSAEIGPRLDDPEQWQAMNKSISIAGEHNQASAGAALEVYKSLWEASLGGQAAVSGADVHRVLIDREIQFNSARGLTVRAVRAYLKSLAEGEDAPVEAVDSRWRPVIPLAERPGAP